MRPEVNIEKLIERLEEKTEAEFDKKTIDDIFLSMDQTKSAKSKKLSLVFGE